MAYYVYAAALYLLLLFFLPVIVLLYFLNGRIRKEIQTRIFHAFRINVDRDENLPTIWFHAASIGEMKVAVRLIEEMKKEKSFNAVLSVFTRTALEEAKKVEGLSGCFLLPLDFPCLMSMTVRKVRPDLLVTIESEFWLSLLHKTKKEGAKIALANGRVSEKAYNNHKKHPLFIKTALGYYDLLLARSEEDSVRLTTFLDLQKSAEIAGNIKYDINIKEYIELITLFAPNNTYICLASTRNGEEEILLESISERRQELFQNRNLTFILAPRHTNRTEEIEKLITSYSFTYTLYSEEEQTGKEEFILVDSFGVLDACYSASAGAFIGGSLVKTGGQNLLEAIARGIPVVFGPDMSNFREETGYFLQHGAVQCKRADEVVTIFETWLNNPEEAQKKGRELQKALNVHRGVVKTYAEKLATLL